MMTPKRKYSTLSRIMLAAFCVVSLHARSHAQCACGGSSSAGAMSYGAPLAMGIEGRIVEGDAIYLNVTVPETAKLTVNGDPTISIGTNRYFVIRNLEPGRKYKFKVVAETANAAGVPMEETKVVELSPGATEFVSLKPFKRKSDQPAEPEEGEEEDGADESDEVSGEDDAAETDGDEAAEEVVPEPIASSRLILKRG